MKRKDWNDFCHATSPVDMLKQPYARVLIPSSSGTYFAKILEFPGCFAEGETPDEAIRNLESVAASWIQAALAQGQEIPQSIEMEKKK